MCQSFSSPRGTFYHPLAFDLAKPGLVNIFPLTWTSLSAVVVASNTSYAPKATPTCGSRIWTMKSYNQCMYLAFHWRTSSLIYFLRRKPHTTLTLATFGMPSLPWEIFDGLRPRLYWSTGLLSMTFRLASRVPKAPLDGISKGFFSSTPMSSGKAVSPPSREDPPPGINESSPFPALDPWTSDDCLSLDIIVPINVYNVAPKIPQEELRLSSGSIGAVSSPSQRNHKAIRPASKLISTRSNNGTQRSLCGNELLHWQAWLAFRTSLSS